MCSCAIFNADVLKLFGRCAVEQSLCRFAQIQFFASILKVRPCCCGAANAHVDVNAAEGDIGIALVGALYVLQLLFHGWFCSCCI